MHPITLRFPDGSFERNYLASTLQQERIQGRAAIIVGTLVYLLYGILDAWHVPAESRSTMWLVRFAALTVPLVVYLLSYTRIFETYRHILLASVGLAAGVGIITMLSLLSISSCSYFYPGLILATFYTYNFIGTRFIHALFVDVSLLLAYNLVFGAIYDYPMQVLITHDFFIVSANLIGGIAGYLSEKQKRVLYIREKELDAERQKQLNRSLHDPLTGLPNRELLYDRMKQAWHLAERGHSTYCGFFIDLDGFKEINDRFGHEKGDTVLCQVAQRLRGAVRESDTVARLGGDEFFFLAHGIQSATEATALANKLIDAIRSPMPDLPADVPLGASIGMCFFPAPGVTDVAEVLKFADQAMYRAKAAGKGTCSMYFPGSEKVQAND